MIKIRLFRRIIYIGETGGYAIYLDTEKNIPLKAEKSKLLNTERAGLQLKYIVPLMLFFSFICKIGHDYFKTHNNGLYYTYETLTILLISCFFTCLVLTFMLEHGLYKNVKKVELATKKEFGQAIRSNNIWRNFSDRKVTKGKKVFAWIITSLVNFISIGYFFILFEMNRNGELLGSKIGFEFFKISLGGGVILFISILLIWQNNPIRWLNIVEKYQKRKLWRK